MNLVGQTLVLLSINMSHVALHIYHNNKQRHKRVVMTKNN